MKRNGLPKFATEFRDRHGTWRIRFRRKGYATFYPKAPARTDQFWAEYDAWLAGGMIQVGASRAKSGSMRSAGAACFASPHFLAKADRTQRVQRLAFDRFCRLRNAAGTECGGMPLALLKVEHIRRLMSSHASRPEGANALLRVLRVVLDHAVETGARKDNPARTIRPFKSKTTGFHSWSEEELTQFEATHPIESKQRLAFALLLYTGQRRGDVVRMGWQHVRDGLLFVRQQKTGAELWIPILPALATVLQAAPREHLTFLMTELGAPFTPAGFGNWFKVAARAAGLERCTAHGLRKAAARRFAERGCTVHEIASWTGHASLKEVQRYTRGADQKRLARAAAEKFKRGTTDG